MPRYEDVEVQLTGSDGNVFAIVGMVTTALQRAGATEADIEEFVASCFNAGNYDQVLQIVMDWVEVT